MRENQRETESIKKIASFSDPNSHWMLHLNGGEADSNGFGPEKLGSKKFCREYGVKWAYVAGAMCKGIASSKLVVAMGKAGLMSYFGTGGLSLEKVESAIREIKSQLNAGDPYGMNLLANLDNPESEKAAVDLYLKHGIRFVEASAFMFITPALVKYRLQGVKKDAAGNIHVANRIMAKISRPEVAQEFMKPPPMKLVGELLEQGEITEEEASLSQYLPMAGEICVEADSAGHTDQGVATCLLPSMIALRKRLMAAHPEIDCDIKIGVAGGIGTPEAVLAAFMLGADFVLTGSINQCSVEAGISNKVKDLLQEIDVQDTAYAPAGDMFEIGARIQVLKKGVFFPSKANNLYELYNRYKSLEEIDTKTLEMLEKKYFHRSIDEVWQETRAYYERSKPDKILQLEKNPKQKMAAIFKWYFKYSSELAMSGAENAQVDYQVHTGPALGAFNQWVKGTGLEDWRCRHVAEIAAVLMKTAAQNFAFKAGMLLENNGVSS